MLRRVRSANESSQFRRGLRRARTNSVASRRAGANRHQTIEELTDDADKIVFGSVIVKNSRWGDDSRIDTDVVIVPDVTLKGQPEGAVVVETLGGVIGDTAMSVSDAPEFAPGERVLVFLKRHRDRYQVRAGSRASTAPASPKPGSECSRSSTGSKSSWGERWRRSGVRRKASFTRTPPIQRL